MSKPTLTDRIEMLQKELKYLQKEIIKTAKKSKKTK